MAFAIERLRSFRAHPFSGRKIAPFRQQNDRFTEMNRFATSNLVTSKGARETAAVLSAALDSHAAGGFWWLLGAHGVVLTAAILSAIGVL